MTEVHPLVFAELYHSVKRLECTEAELRAVVDFLTGTPRTRQRRPPSKIYEPLLFGMFALVVVYGRERYTAARQILHLAYTPIAQRENQARALVRRFDETFFKGEELSGMQEFYARQDPGPRVREFYDAWKRTGLPWPQDIKSETDLETDLRALAMASNGLLDTVNGDYVVALDKTIAASTFESGRR
jgi:hypothetical protein